MSLGVIVAELFNSRFLRQRKSAVEPGDNPQDVVQGISETSVQLP